MESRKQWIFGLLIGTLLTALVFGVMAISPVNAANDGTAILDEGDEPIPGPGGFHGKFGFGHHGRFGFGGSIDYDAFLADALGISVKELQDAREAATDAALEEAVSKGYISEDQAEMIKAGYALRQYIDKEEMMANALGIDAADLQAAREEGKSISSLLDELGLEAADVREALQAAYQEAVQQAVADGVITEDQADQFEDGGFGGRMPGGRPGFGGRGKFPGNGGFRPPMFDSNQNSSL